MRAWAEVAAGAVTVGWLQTKHQRSCKHMAVLLSLDGNPSTHLGLR